MLDDFTMSGMLDPGGLSQSREINEAVRRYKQPFAMEIVKCHKRYLAGDHEQLDEFGRSHYATSIGTIVFSLPKAPPWFAVVQLPQEL